MDNVIESIDFLSFEEILTEYKCNNHWGLSTCIDLYYCDPDNIRDPEYIKQYIKKLCELIDMTTFGEPMIQHFGNDEKVSGLSFMQLIETSSITGHFSNLTNSAYLDIFSCKLYDPKKVIDFSTLYFDAKDGEISYTFRG